jgi:hypothetical protein
MTWKPMPPRPNRKHRRPRSRLRDRPAEGTFVRTMFNMMFAGESSPTTDGTTARLVAAAVGRPMDVPLYTYEASERCGWQGREYDDATLELDGKIGRDTRCRIFGPRIA